MPKYFHKYFKKNTITNENILKSKSEHYALKRIFTNFPRPILQYRKIYINSCVEFRKVK